MTNFLFDFKNGTDVKNWYTVNDTVMGGVSAANMCVNAEGFVIFKGHVSLENNGGFASTKYDMRKTNLNNYSKFVIMIKGDGKTFQYRLKTNRNDSYSYIFPFETTGQWQTIEVSFISMVASFRGRILDMPNFEGESLEEVGFLIGNKVEENFQLMVASIAVQ